MKHRLFIIIIILIFYCSAIFRCHAINLDSLETAAETEKNDTSKVKLLNKLAGGYEYSDIPKAINFANEALKLALEANYIKGIITSYTNLGYFNDDIGNYSQAIKYYSKSVAYLTAINDTFRIGNHFNLIGLCYNYMGDYVKSMQYYRDAIAIYEQYNDSLNISKCLLNLGLTHYNNQDYTQAEKYFKEALAIKEMYNEVLGVAYCYLNLGNIGSMQKNYDEALKSYLKAESIFRKNNKLNEQAYTLTDIGNISQKTGDLSKAIVYYHAANVIANSTNDVNLQSVILANLSSAFLQMNKKDSALFYAKLSLDISLKSGILPNVKEACHNLAVLYDSLGDNDKSYTYYKLFIQYKDSLFDLEKNKQMSELSAKYETDKKEKEIEILNKDKALQNEEINKQTILRNAFIIGFILVLALVVFIFRSYRVKRKLSIALTQKNAEIFQQKEEIMAQADQLAEINKELEKLSIVASETDNSVVIFSKEGNIEWVNAGFTKLFGFTIEEFIRDKGRNLFETSQNDHIRELIAHCCEKKKSVVYSMLSATKSGRKIWVQTTLTPILDEMNDIAKFVAIDSDISKLKEAETAINQQKEEIEAQRDEIEGQRDKLSIINTELSSKNKQITDSINYARLIQVAILPSQEQFRQFFPESFIFFRPRDIVSGDFYWVSGQSDHIFLALVDCTGHGVPGAFMSMIGNTLLNQIVNEKKIFEPSDIIAHLHQGIIYAMSQHGGHESQDEGMELSLCRLNTATGEILLSCTNQVIYIAHSGKLTEIEGEFISVGSRDTIPEFKTHRVSAGNVDYLYLCSDGFQDQFGSPCHSDSKAGVQDINTGGKKFSQARLKSLLTNICTLPVKEQEREVTETFYQWKGDMRQVDDILLIGVKIS